jgi:HSP20 family protein
MEVGIGMSFFGRRRISDEFAEIFENIEEMMRELERMAFRLMESYVPEISGIREVKGPIVYGFRITIGPDGRPIIEEFGNVKRIGRKTIIEEAMEPLVDVIDEKDRVVIVAELPGIDKDKIDIRIKDNKLIIKARNKDRKYYKEIELPAEVRPETAKARYKNGVLEITIEKKKPEEKEEEEGGIKIKVE